MKRSVQVVLGASALALAAATPALAEQKQGPYIGLGGIYVIPQDSNTDQNPGATLDGDIEWDDGWGTLGSLGYAWGNGLRTELELSYRDNNASSIGNNDLGGSVDAMSGMVNVLYDVDVGLPLKPYIGAGAGVSRVQFDNVGPAGGPTIDDGKTSWAWQGIAGASYSLGQSTDLTLDYRYFSAPDVELGTTPDYETEYNTHNIVLGMRFTFGARRPPPWSLSRSRHRNQPPSRCLLRRATSWSSLNSIAPT